MMGKFKFLLLERILGKVNALRRLGVKIGEGCRIYSDYFGTEPWLVSVGNRVTLATGVKFITHDGATWLVRDGKGRRYRYAPITIADDVFVGENSILLAGVSVGNRCIIGAGSLVNRSIPDGTIAAGVPARIIGRFDDYERKALAAFHSEADMRGTSYRERIDSIVETQCAPAAREASSVGS